MLRIESSKDGWIVYESRDFKRFHTHVKHLRVAKKIYHAVKHREIPSTKCIEVLVSCKRLTSDRAYINKLEQRIELINEKTIDTINFNCSCQYNSIGK